MSRSVYQVEKLVPLPIEHPVQVDLSAGDQEVVMHPGAGKTRQVLPRLVEDALLQRKQVVVTAPTHVICSQMYRVLKEYMNERGLPCDIICRHRTRDISKNAPVSSGRVTLIPHAVLARDLLLYTRYRKTPTVFLVDEAHFSDVKSIMLASVLHQMRDDKKATLIELTASTRD